MIAIPCGCHHLSYRSIHQEIEIDCYDRRIPSLANTLLAAAAGTHDGGYECSPPCRRRRRWYCIYTTTTTTTPANISPNIPSTNVPSLSLGDGGAVVVRRMTFHHHHHKMITHSIHPLSSGRLYRTHPPTAAAVITTTTDGPSLSAFGETSQNIHTSHHISHYRERERLPGTTHHTHIPNPQHPRLVGRWVLRRIAARHGVFTKKQQTTTTVLKRTNHPPP